MVASFRLSIPDESGIDFSSAGSFDREDGIPERVASSPFVSRRARIIGRAIYRIAGDEYSRGAASSRRMLATGASRRGDVTSGEAPAVFVNN